MASTNGVNGASAATHTNGASHTNGAPSSYAAKHNIAPHFIGGNHLQAAGPSKVKDFVQTCDGHTVITKVSFESHAFVAGPIFKI